MSAPPFFYSAGRGDLKFWGEDDGSAVILTCRKFYRNLSRSTGWKRWASRRIGWCGAGREKKTKRNTRLKSMEKKSCQTAAIKQKPKQERRLIKNEAKGNQCAGKHGGDKSTSNAQKAKSMLLAAFTQIDTWQLSSVLLQDLHHALIQCLIFCVCVQSSMSSPLHHLSYRRLNLLICLQAPVSLSSCFSTSFSAAPLRIASFTLLFNVGWRSS